MKLTVMANYSSRIWQAGQARKSHFYEPVEVEIDEVCADDAPVATRSRWGVETRWHDSRHFRQWNNELNVSVQDILERLETYDFWEFTRGYSAFSREGRTSLYSSEVFRDYEEAPRVEAIDMARECTERLLLVDGQFWIECSEPYLIRSEDGYCLKLCHDILARKNTDRPNHRHHAWLINLRINRADDIAAREEVEILIPDSIRKQPERDGMLDAARFLLEDYSFHYLDTVHPDILDTLAVIGRGLYGHDVSQIDIDALVDPVVAAVDAIERLETEPRINTPERMASYRKCVQRWLDRDFAMSEIIPMHRVPKP